MPPVKFSKAIEAFALKTKTNLNKTVRWAALRCLRGAIVISPVKEGRFRASWRVAVVSPDLSVTIRNRGKKQTDAGEGLASLGDEPQAHELRGAATRINSIVYTDTVYVSNNLPYAQKLEDGSSTQAQGGLIRPVSAQVAAELDGFIRGLK